MSHEGCKDQRRRAAREQRVGSVATLYPSGYRYALTKKLKSHYTFYSMLTLQFQSEFCDHTSKEARAQQRKGVSTAKRKRSGRIAARGKTSTTTTTTMTALPQDSLCSPKLEDADPSGENRALDAQHEGGVATVASTKPNAVSSKPVFVGKSAPMDEPVPSKGTRCEDSETDGRDDSPTSSGMAKRTRRHARCNSEDATLKKRPTRSTDQLRRRNITYGSNRHSTTRSSRMTASSSKQDNPDIACKSSPCVQVVIPSFPRTKPESSHDHADHPERASSAPNRSNVSRLGTPPCLTHTVVEAHSNASTDRSKEEVLKASGMLEKVPSLPLNSDKTDSITVKQEIGHDSVLLHTADTVHRNQAVDNSETKHSSALSRPPLESKTSCTTIRTTEPAEPCSTMETQKCRPNFQRPPTDDCLEKQYSLSAQQQLHEVNSYTGRSAGRSAQTSKDGHDPKQGELVAPTPSLASFEAVTEDSSSTSVLSSSTTSPRKAFKKPSTSPPPGGSSWRSSSPRTSATTGSTAGPTSTASGGRRT